MEHPSFGPNEEGTREDYRLRPSSSLSLGGRRCYYRTSLGCHWQPGSLASSLIARWPQLLLPPSVQAKLLYYRGSRFGCALLAVRSLLVLSCYILRG
jgi:hypothetical protein